MTGGEAAGDGAGAVAIVTPWLLLLLLGKRVVPRLLLGSRVVPRLLRLRLGVVTGLLRLGVVAGLLLLLLLLLLLRGKSCGSRRFRRAALLQTTRLARLELFRGGPRRTRLSGRGHRTCSGSANLERVSVSKLAPGPPRGRRGKEGAAYLGSSSGL